MRKVDRILLSIGGFFFLSIGAYHIFLPSIWNWSEFSITLPDLIEWALYATNFLLSSLMILLGLATFNIALRKKQTRNPSLLIICLLFWLLNFAYQILVPTPIPRELQALKIGFLVPPIICMILYFIPLYKYYLKTPYNDLL